MLLKPTQGVPHEGGFLFDEQSRYYQILEQWIAEGCQYKPDAARVASIAIYPPTPMLQLRHDQQQLIVIATYADGSSRDVTREAVFETSNFEVATVSKQGLIKAVQRGEAAALVRFEGNYAAALFQFWATVTATFGRHQRNTTSLMARSMPNCNA